LLLTFEQVGSLLSASSLKQFTLLASGLITSVSSLGSDICLIFNANHKTCHSSLRRSFFRGKAIAHLQYKLLNLQYDSPSTQILDTLLLESALLFSTKIIDCSSSRKSPATVADSIVNFPSSTQPSNGRKEPCVALTPA